MTYKYTTIRIQRKEALLGYIVPKGALFIRGNGLQFICTERPKDPNVVTYSHSYNRIFLYSGSVDGRAVINCMVYSKDEIKLLHKKPLRHFIEKRQGK